MLTRDDTLKNNQVEVREIIATHAHVENEHRSYGEFTGYQYKSEAEIEQAAQESGDALVQRMVAHIKNIASEALEIHISDNFVMPDSTSEKSDPILVEDNANCITRLSFQEFHFYPFEERGPLSMRDFSRFIELIDQYAVTLPVNFHLLIATLPVIDSHNRVYNMCVYVQSGSPPKMHTFAKNIPSGTDLEYANTISPMITGGSQEISFINRIKTAKNKIYHDIDMLNLIDVGAIDDFVRLCSLNREFTHDYETNKLLPAYLQVIGFCEEIKNLVDSGQAAIPIDWHELANDFNEATKNFIRNIKDATEKNKRGIDDKISSEQIPSITLPNKVHTDFAINHDGTIHCTTAGGEQFTTIVDICLDHAYGVGFSRYNSNVKRLSEEKSLPMPRLMSHMVTSNTIDLFKHFILARHTTHADAINPTVKDAFAFVDETPRIIPIADTAFGGAIELNVFKPHPVESLRGHYQIKIDLHNLRVELEKFESAKSTHRTFSSTVEKRIAVLREKIESLAEDDITLTRLDNIANTIQRLDLEHLSSRTWVNGYINLLASSISSFINGDRSDELNIRIHDYINAIRDEWANADFSKHDKLANLLEEMEMLLHNINKKRDTLSLNQPPLS